MSRPIRELAAFGMFHVAVLVVAVVWLLACLFVGLILEMSDLPPGGPAMFGIGVVAVILVAPLFARLLKRTRPVAWLPWTLVFATAPVAIAAATLDVVHSACRQYECNGPSSSSGWQSIVSVHDAGFGVGADFYSDVKILGRDGTLLAEWRDPHGWGCRAGPRRQLESMRWTGPDELEFESAAGKVQLLAR